VEWDREVNLEVNYQLINFSGHYNCNQSIRLCEL